MTIPRNYWDNEKNIKDFLAWLAKVGVSDRRVEDIYFPTRGKEGKRERESECGDERLMLSIY